MLQRRVKFLYSYKMCGYQITNAVYNVQQILVVAFEFTGEPIIFIVVFWWMWLATVDVYLLFGRLPLFGCLVQMQRNAEIPLQEIVFHLGSG